MKRRAFLKVGVFGGALIVVAGVGTALIPGDRSVRPRTPLITLDDAQFAILCAFAARVLARTTADPVAVAHAVDATLAHAPPEVRKDLALALNLLDNALVALVTGRAPVPFTQHDEAGQDAALVAWRDSRLALLRSAFQGLRKLTLAAHWATPAAAAAIGYGASIAKPEPPPITARGPLRVDVAAIERARDAELPAGTAPTAPITPPDGGTP